MKNFRTAGGVVLLILFSLGLTGSASGDRGQDTINPVVGDTSWESTRGPRPKNASEHERIHLHLTYVLEVLRKKEVDLDSAVSKKRTLVLDSLRHYIQEGKFPERGDDALSGRRPRFVDGEGTHCAVAHLIAASGETDLVKELNESFEYAKVADMRSVALQGWAEENGMTLDELALIQPSYPPAIRREKVERVVAQGRWKLSRQCAVDHRPPPFSVLKAFGRGTQVQFNPLDGTAFTACFAEQLSRMVEGRKPAHLARGFSYELRVLLTPPHLMLEDVFQRLSLDEGGTGCAFAGAKLRNLRASVSSGWKGLNIAVSTVPENPGVARCLEGHFVERLAHLSDPDHQVRFVRWRRFPLSAN